MDVAGVFVPDVAADAGGAAASHVVLEAGAGVVAGDVAVAGADAEVFVEDGLCAAGDVGGDEGSVDEVF